MEGEPGWRVRPTQQRAAAGSVCEEARWVLAPAPAASKGTRHPVPLLTHPLDLGSTWPPKRGTVAFTKTGNSPQQVLPHWFFKSLSPNSLKQLAHSKEWQSQN